ncbi:MAG: hypothetical protein MI749_11320, partial [Desulfovibrionales bacterium]|nr:hypothetical protein [Desulfovibrionales bacterium]
MISTLKKRYFMGLAPVGLGGCLLVPAGSAGVLPLEVSPIWPRVVFILALASSLGGPVVVRTLFAHSLRHGTHTPKAAFLAFETHLILTAFPAAYLTLVTLVWEFPRFHGAGTLLAALYGLYYQYPSHRRIMADQGIFRVP